VYVLLGIEWGGGVGHAFVLVLRYLQMQDEVFVACYDPYVLACLLTWKKGAWE
jgi:hypothetical protein